MKGSQPSFADAEYSRRRRVTRREEFLTMMDEAIPWAEWVGLVEPVYYNKARGRKPVPIEEFRVAARKGVLKTMARPDRLIESGKASIRAKDEHPFLILKRAFGFAKTRYRGLAKNLNRLHVAFASANLLMRARAVAITAG